LGFLPLKQGGTFRTGLPGFLGEIQLGGPEIVRRELSGKEKKMLGILTFSWERAGKIARGWLPTPGFLWGTPGGKNFGVLWEKGDIHIRWGENRGRRVDTEQGV